MYVAVQENIHEFRVLYFPDGLLLNMSLSDCSLSQVLGSSHLYFLYYLLAYLLLHGWAPPFSGLGSGL